jgi:hypothetical protein
VRVRRAATAGRRTFWGAARSLTGGRARSWRPSDVAMVEATDFANRDDLAEFRLFNRAAVRRVLVEREMRASPVVVGEVAGQDAAQVAFAENQNVIQTLAADRADESLREGILPWALRAVRTSSIPMRFTR